MRASTLLAFVGLGALALVATNARDAKACGGCFQPPPQSGDVITDEKMIFRITPQSTTLYDEIEYSGNPPSFGWVLPIRGHGHRRPELGHPLPGARRSVTQTTIYGPNPPRVRRAVLRRRGGGERQRRQRQQLEGGGGVTVLSQQTVGPYDTVQLQSTDPNALNSWLAANGYVVPGRLPAGHRRVRQRGLRLPRAQARARAGRRGDAPGARHDAGRRRHPAAAHGRRRHGGHRGRHALGRERRPLRAGQHGALHHRRVRAHLGLQHEHEQLHDRAPGQGAAGNFATWQIESSLDVSPYQIEQPVLADPADQDYLATGDADGGARRRTAQARRPTRCAPTIWRRSSPAATCPTFASPACAPTSRTRRSRTTSSCSRRRSVHAVQPLYVTQLDQRADLPADARPLPALRHGQLGQQRRRQRGLRLRRQ